MHYWDYLRSNSKLLWLSEGHLECQKKFHQLIGGGGIWNFSKVFFFFILISNLLQACTFSTSANTSAASQEKLAHKHKTSLMEAIRHSIFQLHRLKASASFNTLNFSIRAGDRPRLKLEGSGSALDMLLVRQMPVTKRAQGFQTFFKCWIFATMVQEHQQQQQPTSEPFISVGMFEEKMARNLYTTYPLEKN